MSGRHTGRISPGLRISALPKTLRLIFRLAPRQLNDEIALAKVEIKRKGIQLGVAAAFFAVALAFLAFLLIGLIVAAIMGLATIMPAWIAALLVCGVFLLIALIGALIGLRKFKKAMPLVPEETVRGLKHDLGIAKEGSAYNDALLDPSSAEAKAAKAAKAEAAAKAKAEKAEAASAKSDDVPAPTEAELRRRLKQRRQHLTGVRDNLGQELDVKTQAQALLGVAQDRLKDGKDLLMGGKEKAGEKFAAFGGASASGNGTSQATAGPLEEHWKPLVALAASTAVLLVLLRKLFKG